MASAATDLPGCRELCGHPGMWEPAAAGRRPQLAVESDPHARGHRGLRRTAPAARSKPTRRTRPSAPPTTPRSRPSASCPARPARNCPGQRTSSRHSACGKRPRDCCSPSWLTATTPNCGRRGHPRREPPSARRTARISCRQAACLADAGAAGEHAAEATADGLCRGPRLPSTG